MSAVSKNKDVKKTSTKYIISKASSKTKNNFKKIGKSSKNKTRPSIMNMQWEENESQQK